MIRNSYSNPKPHFCLNATTAFNFFENRSEWNSNLCLGVKHADPTNVNRIWLYHCGRSLAQKRNHSSHFLSGSCCWCCSSGAGSWRDNEMHEGYFWQYKSWKWVTTGKTRATTRQRGDLIKLTRLISKTTPRNALVVGWLLVQVKLWKNTRLK